jgi:undecaprenyl diphosphate synthase
VARDRRALGHAVTGPIGLLRNVRALRGHRRAEEEAERQRPATAASVAIIMDGNGRWARRRGLPLAAGHRAGARALRRTVEAAPDLGVRSLAVYAFSTENWERPPQEVADLMDLFAEQIREQFADLDRQGVRVHFVGRRDRCSAELRALMADMEERTVANRRLDLWVAFDYGGRDELVRAAQALVREGLDADEIDERAFARHLSAPEMPDPDLLIRTSPEVRISNFLLWQVAYSELHFTPTLWPDFGPADLREALEAYARRRRRYGRR